MKKYILSIALLLAAATATFAQQVASPEERAKWLTENATKGITLTPEQKAKIYDIGLERANAVDALRVEAGEGKKPDPDKMKAIIQKFDTGVKALLSDEQKATLKAKAEEAKAKKAATGN
jgi:Spy/CpxP family protein refolding chaperone